MTTINFLSSVDNVFPGDLLPLWSTFSSDTRKVSISKIGSYFSDNFTFRDSKINSYVAPFDNDVINITTNGGGAWLIIDGQQDIVNLSITFPSVFSLKTGEEIIINVGNINITNVILDTNGAVVLGFPATLPSLSFVKYRYNQISQTWYNQFV